jgi:hypothetical protein
MSWAAGRAIRRPAHTRPPSPTSFHPPCHCATLRQRTGGKGSWTVRTGSPLKRAEIGEREDAVAHRQPALQGLAYEPACGGKGR